MRRAIRIVLRMVGGFLVLAILLVVGVDFFLNTGAGRAFAAREIGRLSGGEVRVTGLGGHFPTLLTARRIALADSEGVYLTIDEATLRWSPLALFRRALEMTQLSAQRVDLIRLPVPSPSQTAQGTRAGGMSLPFTRARIDDLAIRRLSIGPDVAGRAVALTVKGHAAVDLPDHLTLVLDATALDQPGHYVVDAALDAGRVTATIDLHEPPGGMITALAGVPAELAVKPLDLRGRLDGPRSSATLSFAARLGDLAATAKGTVDLSPAAPGADLTVAIPQLGPFLAFVGGGAGNPSAHAPGIAGSTVLRLIAKKDGGTIRVQLHDQVTMTQGPERLIALIGRTPRLDADLEVVNQMVSIRSMHVSTRVAATSLGGEIGANSVMLHGTINEPDLAIINPLLSGQATQSLELSGPRDDLALKLGIGGTISTKDVPSGPFHVAIALAHLPATPRGTVTGGGTLDGAPLAIDADVVRAADGTMRIDLRALSWKSLNGTGTIEQRPGATVPDGTLHLAIADLADPGRLLGVALAGSVQAEFVHPHGAPATLSLTATDLREGRALALRSARIDATIVHLADNPAIDATARLEGLRAPSAAGSLALTAKGTESALAIDAQGDFTDLGGKPARIAVDGMADVPAERIRLDHLTAAARGISLRLLRPATIAAKPGLTITDLALATSGDGGSGTISAAGTLTPKLDLKARIEHLPAAIIRAADPSIAARGTIDAMAAVAGTLARPTGTVTLDGHGLGVTKGPGAGLPPASITARETLLGTAMRGSVTGALGAARLAVDGTAPLAMDGPMALSIRLSGLAARLVHAIDPAIDARGSISATARLTGTPAAPGGTVDVNAAGLRLLNGPAGSLPPITLTAHETLLDMSLRGNVHLLAGSLADFTVSGTAPLAPDRPIDLALNGHADLRLIDPVTEANGTRVAGMLIPDLRLRGTMQAPQASGQVRLANGSVTSVTSGLDLTKIDALVTAADHTLTLVHLSAQAGSGTITGHGTVGLAPPMPIDLAIAFNHASPVSSDLVTAVLGGGVRIGGAVKTGLSAGGTIDIDQADINIPQGLPPSVQKITILRPGEKPPPPPKPGPPIALDLTIIAKNQVFVRGDGVFANLGGRMHLGGTAAHPTPSGGFQLIRGYFDLAGKQLQFTKGTFDFNGNGLLPALDLEATTASSDGVTATLAVTGSPESPQIRLSSSPTLPSDEILAHLIYGTGTQRLSAFQAASLAASLAQLAGFGGGSPLAGVRKALGLSEFSIGGGQNGSSAPTIKTGRYVAPGVYVGVAQSANGQGTSSEVEINLYKGLKLKSTVGTGGGANSGNNESIGLTYQFNY